MVVKNIELAVVVEDSANPDKLDLSAQHGLSFSLKAKTSNGERLLMLDTGPSASILLQNMLLMGIKLQKTEVIVLSHGHYDHTGGLIEALKTINKPILVVAHPKILDPKLKLHPRLRFIGSSFHLSDITAAGGIPLFIVDPMRIADGILTTGEIDRIEPFEKVQDFWTVKQGRLVKDIFPDDQALIIDIAGKGLVIITGCAHSGIINTIKHAQRITGHNRIYAVIGGVHLAKANKKRIRTTVDELVKLELAFIGPCHCTGSKAVNYLRQAFGDRCHCLHTGDIIKL